MLLLKHVINDPFYLFLVITTLEKILLFFIILIPLPQQLQAVLLLYPLLPLLRKLPLSLLLKSIHFLIPPSNLPLSFLTVLNDPNHLLLTASPYHILFINKIHQYLIQFLDQPILLKLELIPSFLRLDVLKQKTLPVYFELIVLFMFSVDFLMQEVNLLGHHLQFLLVFPDMVIFNRIPSYIFHQPNYLILLIGTRVLQLPDLLFQIYIVTLNLLILLNQRLHIVLERPYLGHYPVQLLIFIALDGSPLRVEDRFSGGVSDRTWSSAVWLLTHSLLYFFLFYNKPSFLSIVNITIKIYLYLR